MLLYVQCSSPYSAGTGLCFRNGASLLWVWNLNVFMQVLGGASFFERAIASAVVFPYTGYSSKMLLISLGGASFSAYLFAPII